MTEPSQQAREAAAGLADKLGFFLAIGGNDLAAIRNGIWDDAPGELGDTVRAFARFEQSIRNQCEADKAAAIDAGRKDERERCANLIQRRMDARFEEHGTREWDTNACYYSGAAGEIYEALDEEAEDIIAAIRALGENER